MAKGAGVASGQLADSLWLIEGLAVLELYLGNIDAARRWAELLAVFNAQGEDPLATCILRNVEGWLASYEGNPALSIPCFRVCRGIAQAEGDWDHEANARLALAWILPSLNRPDEAIEEAAAVRAMSLSTGNTSKEAESLIVMGGAQLDLGNLTESARSVADGLAIFGSSIERIDHMTRGLRFAGWIAQSNDDPSTALRFMVVADAEHRKIGFVDPPADVARAAREMSEAGAALSHTEGDAITQAATDAPLASVVDEAVDYLRQVARDSA